MASSRIKDLSPRMSMSALADELVFPESFQEDTAQLIGGFSAGSREITHGKVHLQGVSERILFGDATEPLTGTGIFMGKDGDAYEVRVGNPEGVYLHWDGTNLNIVGFLEEGQAANDVNTNVTTINGGKITADTITATQLIKTQALITATAQVSDATITNAKIVSITADKITTQLLNAQIASIDFAKITNVVITNAMIDSLSASKINTGTLAGISIRIGSGDSIFKADSNGIYLGSDTFASAPFRVNMVGDVIAKSIQLWGTISTESGGYLRTSSGSSRLEFTNGDKLTFYNGGVIKGQIRGGSNSGMVAEVGSFVTKVDEGFYACVNTSYSDFFKFYCTDVSGTVSGVIEAPNSNKIFITDAAGNTLFSFSTSQAYTAKKLLYTGAGDVYIDGSSDNLRMWFGGNAEFYHDGAIKAIIDDNFWTDGNCFADNYYTNSYAFEGDPFPVIETIRGKEAKGKDTKMVKLDHDAVHPVLKGSIEIKKKVKQKNEKNQLVDVEQVETIPGMSLSDLVMVQNEAIKLLKQEIELLKDQIKVKK